MQRILLAGMVLSGLAACAGPSVNSTPVSVTLQTTTPEDTPLSGMLPAATDADGDAVTYTLANAPSHGTATVQADGAFTYTPDANYVYTNRGFVQFNGDGFAFSVSDGHGGINTYAVHVAITPVNDAPQVAGGALVIPWGGFLVGTFAAGGGLAVDAAGRILVAGTANTGVNADFALARYLQNGTLDAAFGAAGTGIVTAGESGVVDEAHGLALYADGRIVVVGSSLLGSGRNFALTRFLPAGSLDTTFGGSGFVQTAIAASDVAYGVALDDLHILVAGSSSAGGGRNRFALAGYQHNGTLDHTFGSNGVVTTAIGTTDDVAYSIALGSAGGILLAGTSYNASGDYDFALARYSRNGAPDFGFDTDGIVTRPAIGRFGPNLNTTNDWARGIVADGSGGVLMAGYYIASDDSQQGALARFNDMNGSIDAAFNPNSFTNTRGFAFPNFGVGISSHFNSITLDSTGRILAAGYRNYQGGNDFALVRYTAAGLPDPTFGAGSLNPAGSGTVFTDLGSNTEEAQSVVVDAAGKILVAGSRNGSLALARYNTDGSLDATFAVNKGTAAGKAPLFTLPDDYFTDLDDTTFTYSATLPNDSALPVGLVFDAASRTLSGTIPAGVTGIKFIATDAGGLSASAILQFAPGT